MKSIDHMELAFKLLFASAELSMDSLSEPTSHCCKRRLARRGDGRKLAQARDLRATTAAHSAILRTQITVASDLLKMNNG